ncbi:MAG: hypothetical protein K6B28_09125 [Lachnospiraceae bacterium]|nr:hypothetical protein [Lachnospiraceae bacterium]
MIKPKKLSALLISMVFVALSGCAYPVGYMIQPQYSGESTGDKETGREASAEAGEEAGGEANSEAYGYTEKDVPVIRDKLTDQTITVRYYDQTPNVPYVGIKEYYDTYLKKSLDKEKNEMIVTKEGDNSYTLTNNYGQATMDTDKDILKTDNGAGFFSLMSLKQEGLTDTYYDGIRYVRVKSVEAEGDGKVELDLGKYDIDIIGEDEDIYFPVATISDIFSDAAYHFASFNGEVFYIQDDNLLSDINQIDPEYSKPLIENLKDGLYREEDIAEYTYNEICFAVDHYYGYPGRAIINDDLKEYGLEEALKKYGKPGEKTIELLKSTNFAEFLCGMGELGKFMADGGHSDFGMAGPGKMITDTINDEINKLANDEELVKLYSGLNEEYILRYEDNIRYKGRYKAILDLREEAYGGEKYVKKGDTAVYVLDDFMGFDIKKWNDYYLGNGEIPDKSVDDIVGIMDAMEDAQNDPEIRNFIIDCSENLGGSLDEVAMLYCLVTGKREMKYISINALTDQMITETYEADLNLDKKFDEKDDRDPYDLNFAVLTSNSAFSCGTFFPMLMKDGGYMILGEECGGGSCSVLPMTTGEGYTYQLSSYKGRVIYGGGDNVDKGIPVDYDMIPKRSDGEDVMITMYDTDYDNDGITEDVRIADYRAFYDIDKLSEAVNEWYGESDAVTD